MILYNVTVNVEDSVHAEWFSWMKQIHIPEVMATGKFSDWKMYKILTRQPDESGVTYSIQYFAKNIEDYNAYQRDHAPALQLKTMQKYGEKLMAFRTVLETV
ncbi:DUF4286 family protein [Oscillatoria amoena NRMC-F 0135]|nr:DUF4286 family protein [Oscillatoria amoena NRMC-F 0135]